jgi:hypothetical protein
LAAVVAAMVIGGCGGNENDAGRSELCAHYDEIVTTAQDFSELDPTETSADELRSRAADFRDRLDALQESATRPRVRAALADLEQSLDDARASAAEAGKKAEDRVAQAEDSLKEVNEKWARLQSVVSSSCK